MQKKVLVFTLIIMLTLTGVSFAASESDIIRIGINYGYNTESYYGLYSNSGFEICLLDNGRVVSVLSISDTDQILVDKDGYYSYGGSTELESEVNQIGLGAYHIQLGATYNSADQMMADYHDLQQEGDDVFPAYDDGWKIFYSEFSSYDDAKKAESKAKSNFGVKTKIVEPSPTRVQFVDKKTKEILFIYDSFNTDFFIRSLEGDAISFNGVEYRGGMGFKRIPGSDLTSINYLTYDEYVYGILPKEMSGSWPVEALKAQAVVARSFAFVNKEKHGAMGFDLCNTTDCQVYGGKSVEVSNSNRAVDETSMMFLTYDGDVAETFYHSNSGGQTASIENVWSAEIPYLTSVSDPFSVGSPNTDWTLSYTAEEISNVLLSSGINVGNVLDVVVTEVADDGRVQELTVYGSKDNAVLDKEQVRKIFGYRTFKSIWYDVETDNFITVVNDTDYSDRSLSEIVVVSAEGVDSISAGEAITISNGSRDQVKSTSSSEYVFVGHGFGHGIGMSQWGAKEMAEQGYTYDEILMHYYSGTEIEVIK